MAHRRARPGPLPRAWFSASPLSSHPAAASCDAGCGSISTISFFRACRPLTCRRPFYALSVRRDERLRSLPSGCIRLEMTLSCARRKSAQTRRPGWPGRKEFLFKKMERSRPAGRGRPRLSTLRKNLLRPLPSLPARP